MSGTTNKSSNSKKYDTLVVYEKLPSGDISVESFRTGQITFYDEKLSEILTQLNDEGYDLVQVVPYQHQNKYYLHKEV